MSEQKDVRSMTPAEFAAAKRKHIADTQLAERQARDERATAAIEKRFAEPRKKLKVIPIDADNRTAPVRDSTGWLPAGRGPAV